MTRRTREWQSRGEPAGDEEDDEINVISADDEELDEETEEEEVEALFAAGQRCDRCRSEDGRVGIDPTCRGAYDGDPVLFGERCLETGLKEAYAAVEGAAVIVEPFSDYSAHYYYRIDEMPAYRFTRDDIEGVSWLLLGIGDDCARCGRQSRFAWLPADRVDPRLPEDRRIFRDLESDMEHLCNDCAAAELAQSYLSLELPMITAEVPRGAMGIVIPTGE